MVHRCQRHDHQSDQRTTSATYAASPTSTTSYWVKITDSANGTAGASSINGATATVTVDGALSISSQPASATIDNGQSDTLSVTAANGTTPYSYQWYIGASGTTTNPISGATSATLAASPTSTTSYWVKVTDSASTTANSATATITVDGALSISTQPASATIDNGQSDTLSVTAANGTSPYSYQWYIGASGTTTNPISGATSATLAVSPTSTTSYWVKITNSANGTAGASSINSATATVTVDGALSISTQPASVTIDNGQSDTLSVTAANGTTPYSYQWYIGASGTTTNPISGATSATYAASPTSTTSYWVKVTDSASGTAGSTSINQRNRDHHGQPGIEHQHPAGQWEHQQRWDRHAECDGRQRHDAIQLPVVHRCQRHDHQSDQWRHQRHLCRLADQHHQLLGEDHR